MNLYITADRLGEWTGGSQVVSNEAAALRELGPCEVWDRDALTGGSDPWSWDDIALARLQFSSEPYPKLCCIYAGCFTKTVQRLRENGCRISYTVAAHDVNRSRKAHEDLGLPFPYEHLNDPVLFKEYIGGYLNADVVVCPSTVSAETVRRQGRTGRIEVLPHGIDLPKCPTCDGTRIGACPDVAAYVEIENGCPRCTDGTQPLKPLPKTFTVGYLGAYGADKGIKTLLEAWRKLSYPDAVLLLGGRDSASPFVSELVRWYGGGNVVQAGWQDNPWDFMDQLSIYVQPSATEGFGIEVLESMARGRPVVCSTQAGAQDAVNQTGCGLTFQAGNADSLCRCIEYYRQYGKPALENSGTLGAVASKDYTWDIVKKRYQALWLELLK